MFAVHLDEGTRNLFNDDNDSVDGLKRQSKRRSRVILKCSNVKNLRFLLVKKLESRGADIDVKRGVSDTRSDAI